MDNIYMHKIKSICKVSTYRNRIKGVVGLWCVLYMHSNNAL